MENTIEFEPFDKYMTRMEKENKSPHTIRAYKASIESFLSYFTVETSGNIENLTVDDVEDYQSYLSETGLSASSVNAHMRNVRAFTNWLVKHKYIKNNPVIEIDSLKEPKKVRAVIEDYEFEAMLKACGNDIQNKLMISLMRYCGLRREEVTNVKIEDINNGKILVHGKGDKERSVPLNDYVLKVLAQYLSSRNEDDSEYLFVSERGKHKITTESIRLRVKSIFEKAGIDPERIDVLSCHSFRRTAATSLLNEGVDAMVVQRILGHSNISTTNHYIQNADKAMEKAIANQKIIGD